MCDSDMDYSDDDDLDDPMDYYGEFWAAIMARQLRKSKYAKNPN